MECESNQIICPGKTEWSGTFRPGLHEVGCPILSRLFFGTDLNAKQARGVASGHANEVGQGLGGRGFNRMGVQCVGPKARPVPVAIP